MEGLDYGEHGMHTYDLKPVPAHGIAPAPVAGSSGGLPQLSRQEG